AERGRANGLMYASKYGGGIIGGAGMSWLIAVSGLRAALVLQVIVLGAIMLVPLLVRERSAPAPKPPALGTVLRSLVQAFSLRSTLLCGALMLGSNLATGMLNAIANVLFTQKLGWTDTEYATLTGGPGLLMGLGGSVLGGFLADRVGHRRLAAIASTVLALLWLTFALGEAWWTDRTFVYALALVEPLCQSVLTVSLFALCMDVSWPRIAATQFTAYMALGNFSTTQGFRLAGHADGWWDYQGIYLAAAGMQIAITLILPLIDPQQTRRTLARDDQSG
ncbi:MAG: muropeptide transporter, partial [Myxococcales bacterium]|nr:muropeptide transporter [Myxococcales bacterium]